MTHTDWGRVGVLCGGESAERAISLQSGAGVCEALRARGVDAHCFDPALQGLDALARAGFDRVFIALHGRYGEDGTMQGALELLHLPYTGSGPLASSLAMDKTMTKRIWQHHGLPTPDFVECADPDAPGAELIERLGLPLIVKPPLEGSTLGLTRVTEAAQFTPALHLARRYGERVLVERFVRGRELTVALLGTGASARALPVVEIIAPDGNYDYQHKYESNDTRYVCPAELPAALAREVQALALRAYRALDCASWGRADLMLDAQDRPWLLEMNTSPGMTSHSLVPMAARASGMDYGDLCLAILETARCKVARVTTPGGAQP